MADGAARMLPACRSTSDSDTDQTASAAASATGAALGSRPLTSVRAAGDSSSDEEDGAGGARRPARPLLLEGAPMAAPGCGRRRRAERATAEQAPPIPTVRPFDCGAHVRAEKPATLTAATLAKLGETEEGPSEAKGGGGRLAAGERAEWAKRNIEWLERTSGSLVDVPVHTLELLWNQQRMQRKRERRTCSHALSGRWTSVLSLDVPCGAGRQQHSDAAMIRQSLDSWQGRANARRAAVDAAQHRTLPGTPGVPGDGSAACA